MTRGTNNAGPAGDKGTSGQNVPKSPKGLKNKKSKFRMESEQEKICTRTSSPRPGDLVFFKGTYDTPGVSHCGIYVGDGMMLHCGDPIQYANLNSSYWQAHFYAYGRLP